MPESRKWKMEEEPEERLEPCPACEGNGYLLIEAGLCEFCMGKGWITGLDVFNRAFMRAGVIMRPPLRPVLCFACKGLGHKLGFEHISCPICEGCGVLTGEEVEGWEIKLQDWLGSMNWEMIGGVIFRRTPEVEE